MQQLSALVLTATLFLLAVFAGPEALADGAPRQVTIGTLYASVGPFAVASQNELKGLEFWADRVNQGGGVFVKAFGKKLPVKIIKYDDRSADYTARDLYTRLIEHDHVDVLVSDFGSVLTEPGIQVAKDHHMLLIDQTGSSASFFSAPTDYLADVSIPSSQLWPVPLSRFVLQKKYKQVAILFALNPFDSSQAKTFAHILLENGIYPYFKALRNSDADFPAILRSLQAAHPDAVFEFGYAPNDVAFFRAMSQTGVHFPMTFTIFPGQLQQVITRQVGAKALAYSYTYATPPLVKVEHVNYGMNTDAFVSAFQGATHAQPDFLNVAGYNTGLIVQHMLDTAPRFDQLAFHQAIMDISGDTTTLLGPFKVDANGAQIGQPLPVAQLVPDGSGGDKMVVVYPTDKAHAR